MTALLFIRTVRIWTICNRGQFPLCRDPCSGPTSGNSGSVNLISLQNGLENCDTAPLTHIELSTNQTILMFLSHIYTHTALFYNDF